MLVLGTKARRPPWLERSGPGLGLECGAGCGAEDRVIIFASLARRNFCVFQQGCLREFGALKL